MTVLDDKELQCQPEPFVIQVSFPDTPLSILKYPLLLFSVAFLVFSLILSASFSAAISGEEGAGWTSDDPAQLGWEEVVRQHLPLQRLGQAVLPGSCQVRNLWVVFAYVCVTLYLWELREMIFQVATGGQSAASQLISAAISVSFNSFIPNLRPQVPPRRCDSL